ncbi:MAG: glycoside hydrolase family 3 C-terminal domain-containing protein [Lachnospiraceae bacterium]|nr:glycoside hydrolase family 3 C-terminal domain-containing protein [Butyrivibrio sp.]MCM1342358.1 glycoside hydrolase family 3 C-terminal domain-containing protein [Muribaculaceae bacterium]MCM1410875.1 glycoside hydrolase family 3 C-terminal domain-containing protein [Lachnospiraceae bacterium]
MDVDRERARERARELVGRMTLEEKAEQLKYNAPAIERLGVPSYNWWNEGLHGVARAGVATMFPQAIGMGAAFDRELMERVGDVIATEGRAKYNAYTEEGDRDIYKGLTFWSPNINIFRDPRWGRGHETYGEDPYLTGELGKAFVEGLQGDGEYMKAAACAKHFAVHSGPEGLRHEFNAEVSKKDLWETYLPAFEKLVREAKVEAVMGAYNRTNGEPCCGSGTLIGDILRGRWEFQGHFVSDCWAIRDFHTKHMVTDTAEESAAMALKAGCDVNCGSTYLQLLKAYEQGLVTEEDITQAAERLFTTRFLLGLFDGTEYDKIGYEKIECREHLQLADQAAAESVVLLKNTGILPLDRTAVKTIGVIGPNANSRAALIGNYHGTSSRYITVLEGIQDAVGEDVRICYSEGCHLFKNKVENLSAGPDRISEAAAVAKRSDVVILCLGLDESLEGEGGDASNSYASGDKADLLLPEPQRKLLEAMAEIGKPVVLINMTGSAMDLRYAHEHCAAVLQAWYPGARGGRVIADILFGEISPSGKLPVTFYRDVEDLPAFTDYSMKGRTYRYLTGTPLYPFGYGLTYGDVALEHVDCCGATVDGQIKGWGAEERTTDAPTKSGQAAGCMAGNGYDAVVGLQTGAALDITAAVTNKGARATDEVVQVYIRDEDSIHATPVPRLCGFARVSLQPGETKQVRVPIDREAFTVVNEEGERLVDGKRFLVSVGFGQPDTRTRELTGKECAMIEIMLK